MRVIIADDDPIYRKIHSYYLADILPGVVILEASDGLEAVRLGFTEDVSFILSDVAMPLMDGFDLLKLMRSSQTKKDLPVVMVTGDGSPVSAEVLRLAGATAVITKPVRKEEMRRAIEEIFEEPDPFQEFQMSAISDLNWSWNDVDDAS